VKIVSPINAMQQIFCAKFMIKIHSQRLQINNLCFKYYCT